MKVHEILDDQLFIRGQMLKMDRNVKRAELADLGVTRIVNLWSRADPDLLGIPGLTYEVYPIPDGRLNPAQATVLRLMARSCAAEISRGGKVLIQCHAGRNRSALLAAMVVQELNGCSGELAIAHVRMRRPRAIAQPAFEGILL